MAEVISTATALVILLSIAFAMTKAFIKAISLKDYSAMDRIHPQNEQ